MGNFFLRLKNSLKVFIVVTRSQDMKRNSRGMENKHYDKRNPRTNARHANNVTPDPLFTTEVLKKCNKIQSISVDTIIMGGFKADKYKINDPPPKFLHIRQRFCPIFHIRKEYYFSSRNSPAPDPLVFL